MSPAAEHYNLDAEAVLGNVRGPACALPACAGRSTLTPPALAAQIIWTRIYTTDALYDCLANVAAQFAEQPFKARTTKAALL